MQTLKHIGIIALNTFRESIRDKILYNIGFLAIALTLFSIVLGEWSVFDRAYVIKSTTLSVMSLSGLLISIFDFDFCGAKGNPAPYGAYATFEAD